MFFSDRRGVARRLTAGASVLAIGLATAGQAFAQAEKTKESNDSTVEEVVVVATGTNIAGVKAVGSETVTMTADDIKATGLTDIHQVLKSIPQIQSTPNAGGAGQNYREGGTTGYGGNSTQGTAVNIRGIGYGATLTLVDGRRIAPSGASDAYTEAIQVPIAALERVDVIADGASAIYGADAVSGVINYVLRKNFDGAEATARATTHRFSTEVGGSFTIGRQWDNRLGHGNVILTADVMHRTRGKRSESPLLMQDLRRFGGEDNRQLNGAISSGGVGNLVVSANGASGTTYTYYGLPTNAGVNPTASQLTGTNLVDTANYNDYLPDVKRRQLALFFNQELNDWLSVYYEGFYTHRKTSTYQYDPNTGSSINVCAGTPYYVSGVAGTPGSASTTCPGGGETFDLNFHRYIGLTETTNPDKAFTQTIGLSANLPVAGWRGEAYYTNGADRTCGICNIGKNVNLDAVAAQVNAGTLNPFSTAGLGQSQIASFTGSNVQYSRNIMDDAVIKFNGPLFSLPGGTVRAAFGGEYSRQHETLTNGANRGATNVFGIDNVSDERRKVKSLFAELYVPIFGSGNALPLVQSLAVDVAARYDDYSDFGDTTNPKIGLTWAVNDALSFRGSAGKSFRAPTLTDKSPVVFSAELVGVPTANNSGDSNIGNLFPGFTSALVALGNNQDLQPETADTLSVGFDFSPPSVRGLKISGTYYKIDYQNQISSPNRDLYLASAANRAAFANYITPIHNPATCVPGNTATYDPVLRDYLAGRIADYVVPVVGTYCQVNVILDARKTNLASTVQDGVDLQASYLFETPAGRWNVGGSVTKILHNKVQASPNVAEVDRLDQLYYPVSLRGRANLGWSKGPWSANLFVNYTGDYTNTIPLTVGGVVVGKSKVPSWTTFDLGLSYMVPAMTGPAWLKGVRASLNVQNVADKDPPVVLTTGSAFDGNVHNVLGRVWSLQVTKSF
ncbi:TonB-dependent receptor domain-containing protein [Caulobacter sp. RL271]|uniref:TonB-dependent receptor n=1 Tax=Caulobacter segnis TaxID=88688 RepID=A0ABY5A1B9_9CAUL|nr:TonB-dependent receptor [Caulobacter segnis]USQ98234.1 TonB-dependent receptor [Caulobacter segnis]